MALIEWADGLIIGFPAIDAEHHRLVDMLNALYQASIELRGQEVLRDIVSGMLEYASTHFKREETLMARFGYDKLDEHRAEHEQFVASARQIKGKLESGSFVSSIDTLSFLKSWLVNHILDADKKYGPCFLEHRAEIDSTFNVGGSV